MFRWCDLMRRNQAPGATDPAVFVAPLYLSRLRTRQDREKAMSLFKSHFATSGVCGGGDGQEEIVYRVTEKQVQIGSACLERDLGAAAAGNIRETLLPGLLEPMEAMMRAIDMGWMVLLTGAPATGKTGSVRALASLLGRPLREMTMSGDSDTADLLGSFELVELAARASKTVAGCKALAMDLAAALVKQGGGAFADALALNKHSQALKRAGTGGLTGEEARNLRSSLTLVEETAAKWGCSWASDRVEEMRVSVEKLVELSKDKGAGRFEWCDGMLAKAMMSGEWVLLESVNLCNPTVTF